MDAYPTSYFYLYTSDKWDIPWYTTRERCIPILYTMPCIENTVSNARSEGRV